MQAKEFQDSCEDFGEWIVQAGLVGRGGDVPCRRLSTIQLRMGFEEFGYGGIIFLGEQVNHGRNTPVEEARAIEEFNDVCAIFSDFAIVQRGRNSAIHPGFLAEGEAEWVWGACQGYCVTWPW